MGTIAGFLIFVLLAFVVVYVAMGVRIVRPYQKGVVEQLGRYKETVDPGLRIIKPVLERIRTVDMREQVIDVPPQEVITEDNVAVSVDAVISRAASMISLINSLLAACSASSESSNNISA